MKRIALIAAAGVIAALVLGGCSSAPQDPANTPKPTHNVAIEFALDGLTDTATPCVLTFASDDGETTLSHACVPAAATDINDSVMLPEGTYSVVCVPFVNPDGSTYRMGTSHIIDVLEDTSYTVRMPFVAADEVSQSMLLTYADLVKSYVEHSDGTFNADIADEIGEIADSIEGSDSISYDRPEGYTEAPRAAEGYEDYEFPTLSPDDPDETTDGNADAGTSDSADSTEPNADENDESEQTE